jgi:hypothetical protein
MNILERAAKARSLNQSGSWESRFGHAADPVVVALAMLVGTILGSGLDGHSEGCPYLFDDETGQDVPGTCRCCRIDTVRALDRAKIALETRWTTSPEYEHAVRVLEFGLRFAEKNPRLMANLAEQERAEFMTAKEIVSSSECEKLPSALERS